MAKPSIKLFISGLISGSAISDKIIIQESKTQKTNKSKRREPRIEDIRCEYNI
jgi:hypothetical protein